MPTKIRVLPETLPVERPHPPRSLLRTAWLAAVFAVAAFAASNAHAGSDFEDAFEAELGRIAAHHVAAVGQLVFFGGPAGFGGHPPVVERVVEVERVHVTKHRPRHHAHGPRCGHRWKHHRHHHHRHWRKHARHMHRKHHRWERRNYHEHRHHRRHHRHDDAYTRHDDDRRDRHYDRHNRWHRDRHA